MLNTYKETYNFNFEIKVICKPFDELVEDDLHSDSTTRLHLFSNILDVNFDMANFVNLFQMTCLGRNFFICVGPYYSNSKRVDDFMTAISPEQIYASKDYSKRQFEEGEDWTLSMRIFYKLFNIVENVSDIRKRIQNSHKHAQFFTGYILDCVSQELKKYSKHEEANILLRALSTFDVRSDKAMELKKPLNSKLAVINNIITRGMPTIAPISLEKFFSEFYHVSEEPLEESCSLIYKSNNQLVGEELFEALHIIDPRLNEYNVDLLESDFEKNFIQVIFDNPQTAYLTQLLEPQRPLSTIVSIPNRRFLRERRVDFSLQLPYSEEKGGNENGFIIEIDGEAYHSNIFNSLNDLNRDYITNANKWETTRINNLESLAFIKEWEDNPSASNYLKIIKQNYNKRIEGRWADVLQILLTPFAVARIQKVLLESIMSGNLSLNSGHWDILVVERDVPCAYIAIKELRETYETYMNCFRQRE